MRPVSWSTSYLLRCPRGISMVTSNSTSCPSSRSSVVGWGVGSGVSSVSAQVPEQSAAADRIVRDSVAATSAVARNSGHTTGRGEGVARETRPRGRRRSGLTYGMAVVWSLVAILLGYAVLDVADAAPGVLTLRPLPPPPPTETVAPRTLPLVPQPTVSTSVDAPLPPLAGDAAAPSPAGVERALAPVLALPALRDSALVVRDGQAGRVLLDQRGQEPRIPASTTKLLSAAAISQSFDADERLRTVVREGAAPDDIVLVAGGDSLLAPGKGDPDAVAGHAGLGDLADQVAAALKTRGTRKVTLHVDERYAAGPTTAPTWAPTFRSSGITGAVAMLGLSSQRARGGAPGPADPVTSVRALFARQLKSRGIDVTVAARGTVPETSSQAPTGTPTGTASGTASGEN